MYMFSNVILIVSEYLPENIVLVDIDGNDFNTVNIQPVWLFNRLIDFTPNIVDSD